MVKIHLIFLIVSYYYFPCFANIMPEFVPKEDQLILKVEEGPKTVVGSVLHKFKGNDWDGDTLTFSLSGAESQIPETFKIERTSKTEANLVLKQGLDREAGSEYIFDCLLSDGRTKKPAVQSILVLVMDVNDNPPKFEISNHTFEIPENSAVPRIIFTFEASDPDEGPNGEVNYTLRNLTNSDKRVRFNLTTTENDKAILYLMSPLDYETTRQHVVQVVATDNPNNESSTINIRKETVINVTIKVVDVNDQSPVFLNVTPPITELPEDVPLSTPILRVTAVDGDTGINSTIYYDLLNEQDKFIVDPYTGVMKTRYRFNMDRQTTGVYRLRVRATETEGAQQEMSSNWVPSSTARYTEREVVINVTEVWGSPQFINETYVGHLFENSPPGYPVIMNKGYVTQVCDFDKGSRDLIRLRVEGDGDTFEVVPSEGFGKLTFQILVKSSLRLDYERLQEIDFYLLAEDSAGNSTRLLVKVHITDQNDNSPSFERTTYSAQIPENPPHGLLVTTVNAKDKDSGMFGEKGIRYVKLRGLGQKELGLDEVSGQIKVNGRDTGKSTVFNREKYPEVYLTIEAKDNTGQGNSDTTLLIIQLLDENDNAPQFTQPFYSTEIHENQQDISLALRVSSYDLDQPETKNSEIVYSLLPNDHYSDHLEIHPSAGILFLKKPFDFELLYDEVSKYPNLFYIQTSTIMEPNKVAINFTIQASDLGDIPLHAQVNLTLYIWDKNDCAPKFNALFYNVTVREDFKSNQEILRVEAMDEDISQEFNKVAYNLKGESRRFFSIDPNSGVITLANDYGLDWDLQKDYTFSVECTDEINRGQDVAAAIIVNVTVLDVNNKAPIFIFPDMTDTSENNVCGIDMAFITNRRTLGYYTAKIKENTPIGVMITKVVASDPDSNAQLKYSIDMNDNGTKYFKTGKQIKMVNIRDESHLDIHPETGVVTIGNVPFDYEMFDHARVKIWVEDTAGELNTPQVASSWLLIEVQNVVDVQPKFRKMEYTAKVKENSVVGTQVLRVEAVGETEIKYFVVVQEGEERQLPFKVNVESGDIQVAGVVDREIKDWYNFSVKAVQKGLSSLVPVFIQIEDENDNMPVFIDFVPEVSVEENLPPGTVIAQVKAEDRDTGDFGRIMYTLDQGTNSTITQGKFVVDPTSGVISISTSLDREEQDSYELVVNAIDNPVAAGFNASNRSHIVSKVIHVQVTDVNDNAPKFHFLPGNHGEVISEDSGSNNSKEYIVLENVPSNFTIFSFTLSDEDKENTENSKVAAPEIESQQTPTIFELREPKNGSSTWKLVPARSLLGMQGNHTIILTTRDNGQPPNKAFQQVHIVVKEVADSDNPAIKLLKFAQTRFTAAVTPGFQEDTEILQVALFYPFPDFPYNLIFVLAPSLLTMPQCLNMFAIDPFTGKIRVTVSITMENSKPFCHFKVVASSFRHLINITANVTIFRVFASEKIEFVSKSLQPLENTNQEIWKQAYYLGSSLKNIFGLLVNVEPTVIGNQSITFLVSIACPKTNHILNISELRQIFQFAKKEQLQPVFKQFKINFGPVNELEAAAPITTAAMKFLFGFISPPSSSTNGGDIDQEFFEESFLFQDADTLYLYFSIILGYIIMVELILVILVIIIIRVYLTFLRHAKINKEPARSSKEIVLQESEQLPLEITELFNLELDICSEDGEMKESDC